VAARRRDYLVLVIDVGRGVEELLQATGPEERRRSPEALDLAHLIRDGDVGLRRNLLADDLLWKDGRERLRPDRLARGRVQRRLQHEREVRDQVVPALRQRLLVEEKLRLFYANPLVSLLAGRYFGLPAYRVSRHRVCRLFENSCDERWIED